MSPVAPQRLLPLPTPLCVGSSVLGSEWLQGSSRRPGDIRDGER